MKKQVVYIGVTRCAYKVLVGKTEGKGDLNT
jgi:hypothetical protein